VYELAFENDIACLLYYFNDVITEVVLTLGDGQSSGSRLVRHKTVRQLQVGEAVHEHVSDGLDQGIDFRASVGVSVERGLVDELETGAANPQVLGTEVRYESVWLGQLVGEYETAIGPCCLVSFRGGAELVFCLEFEDIFACGVLVAPEAVAGF